MGSISKLRAMNSKLFLFFSLWMWYTGAIEATAQSKDPDPVLLKINERKITRAEFEASLNREHPELPSDRHTVSTYLSKYIDNQLKINEAREIKLDTLSQIRGAEENYARKILAEHSVLNDAGIQWSNEYIARQQAFPETQTVCFIQIFKALPQQSNVAFQEQAIGLFDNLYAQLRTNKNADFTEYINLYSDDKQIHRTKPNECVRELEEKLRSMVTGEVSPPFTTPQGVHIVKILEKRDLSREEIMEEAHQRKMRRYNDKTNRDFLDRLSEKMGCVPDQQAISELLSTGTTEKVLFTAGRKAFTGFDFRTFTAGSSKNLKSQFDDFLTKSMLDQEQEMLKDYNSEICNLLHAYKDELLLTGINDRELYSKARTDKAGLKAFFTVHKKQYRWKTPRYRGGVIHARNKKALKAVKNKLKRLSLSEWVSFVKQHYSESVKIDTALFKPGDNPFIDKKIYKTGDPQPLREYPYYDAAGKKQKFPIRYGEVFEQLSADYEVFLEAQWRRELHRKYRVEIHEEVIKTVNNH